MTGPIVVVNPNANPAVTQAIDDTLVALRVPGLPRIETMTSLDGPFGVETQADADAAIDPLVKIVEARRDAAAIVLACFSDPGIDACRAAARVPVFGIQESGMQTALCRGRLAGVIAIGDASIPRHREYMRRMGILNRLANERALNISVDDSAQGTDVLARLEAVGGQLLGDGADVLVLGCAGMARHREPLERALGVPVVDPTFAAVTMAIGTLLSADTE